MAPPAGVHFNPYNPQNPYGYPEYESCSECEDGEPHQHLPGKKRVRRFSMWRVMKRYYIAALFVVIGIALNEEFTNPNSQLGSAVRYYLDHPTWSEFMIGNAKPMGHIKDTVPENPTNMTLKDFLV